MPVLDLHSHVLPGIDDGSPDVETSLEMLRLSAQQGVEAMVATPHFYAWRNRVERFLRRRQRAFEQLAPHLLPGLPDLYLGAEVAFFEGISEAEMLEELTLEGTNVLLLELPFRPWSGRDLDEVEALIERRDFQVVLAHLERYLMFSENRPLLLELMDMPLQVQINAESLLSWRGRGRLLKWFRNDQAHLLGSDCHGVEHRVPNLGQGREILRKKLGQDILDRIDRAGARLLPEGKTNVE